MTADNVDHPSPAEYRTVSGMLRQLAASQPDAPMLTAGDRTLTWGELYRKVRRVGQALSAKGVGRGDRVAFLDRNSIEFFEIFFGCALIGAVNVTVNWRLAPAEMAGIVMDAGAVAMFVGTDYADAAKEIAAVATSVREWVSLDGLASLARRQCR